MPTKWMVVSLLLLSPGSGPLFAQTNVQKRALTIQGDTSLSGPPIYYVPRWSGSRLVGCDQCQSAAPILWAVDRQGRREEIVLTVPGSSFVSAWSVASGSDGSVAVAGDAVSGDSRMAEFIAWISPDRKRQVLTRVWPFHPYEVAVAPDGTIWAVGPVLHEHSSVYLHANVLRHYEPNGRLLETASVRGTQKHNGIARVSDGSALMVSNDRVGWLTTACEYIEFSFTAVELGRYTCPAGITDSIKAGGVGLSSADDLLIGGRTAGNMLAPLELERSTGLWHQISVAGQPRAGSGILGFDGLTLVTYPDMFTLKRLNWQTPATDR
jgi:hypothetical protein